MESARSTMDSYRAGYVAIIGEPNVGKSTLMNALVGQKISVVTSKPQTTRHKILGILSQEESQVIFLDTPGLLNPKYLLHESMMKAARSAIRNADLVLFMADATNAPMDRESELDLAWQLLESARGKVYLVINKVDLVNKADIATAIVYFDRKFSFKEVFPISALTLSGTSELLRSIVNDLPMHPPYYPPDIVSEQPERFFVAEIIREKIFEQFRDEIPYSTAVDIIDFREQRGKKDHIQAEIIVERESQKGIVIGKQGKALKEVGELARKGIEQFLGRGVFLEIHVKVREQWRKSAAWLKRLGYDS